MDLADIAALLGADLTALAAIAVVSAFVAKDGTSARTRTSVLGGIGVVILVVGLAAWPRSEDEVVRGLSTTPTTPSTPAKPKGQIVSPARGDSVGRDIEARGILANIPKKQHVWVVVRDGNLLYPQDSEVTPPDGPWSLSFHQGGVTKSISLELYRMSDEGNRFIHDRLHAGDFSGISRIPSAERLDAVGNLRVRG